MFNCAREDPEKAKVVQTVGGNRVEFVVENEASRSTEGDSRHRSRLIWLPQNVQKCQTGEG